MRRIANLSRSRPDHCAWQSPRFLAQGVVLEPAIRSYPAHQRVAQTGDRGRELVRETRPEAR